MDIIIYLIIGVAALAVGVIATVVVQKAFAKSRAKAIIDEATSEAENIKKTKILEYYYMTPEQTDAKEMTTLIKSVDEEKIGTQVAKGPGAVCQSVVRRLTPMECERLQGYPDGWTDIGLWTDSKGKKHKDADSPKYKALGNSIAIPPWTYVLSRLNRFCTEHTMASLFDGIGGFPLIWETLNGKGSCLWASEIEEFPIAVTKYHFGG